MKFPRKDADVYFNKAVKRTFLKTERRFTSKNTLKSTLRKSAQSA